MVNRCRFVVLACVVAWVCGCASGESNPSTPDATDTHDTVDVLEPDTTEDTGSPDTSEDTFVPPSPTMIQESGTIEATVETLYTGAAQFARSMGGDTILLDTQEKLLQVGLEGDEPTELTDDMGALHDVVNLTDGTVIVSTDLGIYVQIHEAFIPSPLGDFFQDVLPVSMKAADLDGVQALWIAAGDAVYLWRGDQVFPIEIPEYEVIPTEGLQWSFGPLIESTPSLWLGVNDMVLGLQLDSTDDTLDVWTELEDAAAIRMAADGAGQLWVVQDGDIHLRDATGDWQWLRIEGEAIQEVAAHPDASGVWIVTDQRYWYASQQVFSTVTGVEPAGSISVDSSGRALVLGAESVQRINPGEPQIPVVTWQADIEPLHIVQCGGCHGPTNYFVEEDLYLDTPAQWEVNIEKVLSVIEPDEEGNSAMPLGMPTMSFDDRMLIKYWQLSGFPVE